MITDVKRMPPFIHFGFHEVERTIEAGQSIDVWLHTIYNLETYAIAIVSGLPKVKKSNYQYTITPAVAGTYTVYFTVQSKDPAKSIDLQSNSITLTVT